MGRNLIIGDIHSQYEKMKNVLDKSCFCKATDTLYSVGDLCDRGQDSVKVLDFMFSLPSLKMVLGNHDLFLLEYLETKEENDNWLFNNGGMATLDAIRNQDYKWRLDIHKRLLETPFAILENNNLIVHGGVSTLIKDGPLDAFIGKTVNNIGFMSDEYYKLKHEVVWNRSYYANALRDEKCECLEDCAISWPVTMFIGHTTIKSKPPCPYINQKYKVINVDTGGYKEGGLITVMDMDSKEYWQA